VELADRFGAGGGAVVGTTCSASSRWVPGPVAELGSGLGLPLSSELGTVPSEECTVVDHRAVECTVEDAADCCQWRGGSAGMVLGW